MSIELLPFGEEEHRRPLGTLVIENDGSGDAERGNYDIVLYEGERRAGVFGGRRYAGRIEGFPRQKLNASDLTLRALAALIAARSGLALVDADQV